VSQCFPLCPGREDFALSSDTGMELLLVGLPIFAEQEAAVMAAE
jgi:hypothetical protein